MLKKGKQTFILIFSKEFVVAVIILLNSQTRSIDEDTYFGFSESPEIYQCCISRSNNSGFKESLKSLKFPSPILDSIQKLKLPEISEKNGKNNRELKGKNFTKFF